MSIVADKLNQTHARIINIDLDGTTVEPSSKSPRKPKTVKKKAASSSSFKAVSLAKALRQTATLDFCAALNAERKKQLAIPTKRIVLSTRAYLLSQAGRFFWNNVKHVAMNARESFCGRSQRRESLYAAA